MATKDINLLIIGEKGAGKSTFINAFINYIKYNSLEQAVKDKLQFAIKNESVRKNEQILEDTSLYGARAYTFVTSKHKYRLIDTPGYVDGGVEDNVHLENTLLYIGQYTQIHGFCFLFNSNKTEINPFFKSVVKQIFTSLHHKKPACNNSLFVFTNSRNTYYQEGDLAKKLLGVLREIEVTLPNDSKIPYTKDNTFFIDNELFKYASAVNGAVDLKSIEHMGFESSWKASQKACSALNALLLSPVYEIYQIKNTLSVNEAKQVIIDLYKPLVDVLELIHYNIALLNAHQHFILNEVLTPEDLQAACYTPVMKMKSLTFSQPATVCTSPSCSTIDVTSSGIKKYVYNKTCHNVCFFRSITPEIISPKELSKCLTFKEGVCSNCACSQETHMHLLYNVEYSEDKIPYTVDEIETSEDMIRVKFSAVTDLQALCDEYEQEKEFICKMLAEFYFFLRSNCSLKNEIYNDDIQNYYSYLIKREKSLNEDADDMLLERYHVIKSDYEMRNKMLDIDTNETLLSSVNVFKFLECLYKLERTGPKIRELHTKQQKARQSELKNKECFAMQTIAPPKKKEKANANVVKNDAKVEDEVKTKEQAISENKTVDENAVTNDEQIEDTVETEEDKQKKANEAEEKKAKEREHQKAKEAERKQRKDEEKKKRQEAEKKKLEEAEKQKNKEEQENKKLDEIQELITSNDLENALLKIKELKVSEASEVDVKTLDDDEMKNKIQKYFDELKDNTKKKSRNRAKKNKAPEANKKMDGTNKSQGQEKKYNPPPPTYEEASCPNYSNYPPSYNQSYSMQHHQYPRAPPPPPQQPNIYQPFAPPPHYQPPNNYPPPLMNYPQHPPSYAGPPINMPPRGHYVSQPHHPQARPSYRPPQNQGWQEPLQRCSSNTSINSVGSNRGRGGHMGAHKGKKPGGNNNAGNQNKGQTSGQQNQGNNQKKNPGNNQSSKDGNNSNKNQGNNANKSQGNNANKTQGNNANKNPGNTTNKKQGNNENKNQGNNQNKNKEGNQNKSQNSNNKEGNNSNKPSSSGAKPKASTSISGDLQKMQAFLQHQQKLMKTKNSTKESTVFMCITTKKKYEKFDV